jgi:nucleotide-binding universal stress UspA family protein
MKRILIPTDFSENAWNAIKYGLQLLQTKCTIYFLHVEPLPLYAAPGDSVVTTSKVLQQSLAKENKRLLKELMSQIKELPLQHKHTFVTLTYYDYLLDCIKREVENKKIDLIIMGTKGASGLKRMTLGSNTGAVITKVKCPLLAIPENTRFKKPREIAFPTDYHIGYDIKVLDNLVEVITENEAILRILHISKKGEVLTEEQSRNKDFLEDYLSEVPHSFHTLTGAHLHTSVQCFVESRNVDMIAMVAKNLNFFQRILFRPAIEEISYHTDVPFLVLHE